MDFLTNNKKMIEHASDNISGYRLHSLNNNINNIFSKDLASLTFLQYKIRSKYDEHSSDLFEIIFEVSVFIHGKKSDTRYYNQTFCLKTHKYLEN